jgi:hypothetical protein|tara:strand:- start:1371 stop:2090 length:720 start_codon:yes stop_codon:yes gene_type:complete
MSIKFQKPEQQPNKFLAPAGTHIARCFKMIHVGTLDYEYQGEPKKKNSLWVYFELPNETQTFNPEIGEQPYSVNIEYNLTYYEAAKLFKHVNSWRGRTLSPQEIDDFEVSSLIGEPCMLTIVHNNAASGKTYANINSITGMPKGMECPKQVNDSYLWDYNENFSMAELEKFPPFLVEKIKSTPEFKSSKSSDNLEAFQKEWHDANPGIESPAALSKAAEELPNDFEDLNQSNNNDGLPF